MGSGCSKSEMLDSPDMPTTSSAIAAAAFVAQTAQHFGKMPLEDRTKYEKLCSNDEITSDDSDCENVRIVGNSATSSLVPSNSVAAGVSNSLGQAINHKKMILKQIATTNHMIHEKLHAVGQKVNKTQVKAPIVRKLKTTKTKISDSVSGVRRKDDNNAKRKPAEVNKVGADQEHDNQDDQDSIGSASDLRAEAEDDFDQQDDGRTHNGLRHVKVTTYDDGISQSVKTCGSSAYHAECESVATNEDDVSRVVVKVFTKKRERISDSSNTIIDENQLSPSSADLLHKYGDKPLLLDDELDYDSDENTESKEDQTGGQSSEELDVFAMAPFKMPKSLPKKLRAAATSSAKQQPPKFDPPITPIVEDPTLFAFSAPDAVKDSFWTSTPKKLPDDQNVFSTYLTQETKNALVTAAASIASVDRYEFNEPIFSPFPEQINNINCSIDAMNKIPVDSQCNEIIATMQKDMFGSEPFPNVHIVNASENKNIVENNNNQIKVERIAGTVPQAQKKLVSLVNVNTSATLDNNIVSLASAQHQHQLSHAQLTAAKYINYSKPDQMLPIADSDYVIISPISNDDEEVSVFSTCALRTPPPNASTASSAPIKSSKKDKSAGKYSYLKEKSSKQSKDDASARVALPSILASKVKGSSSLSYKKVKRHSKNDDEDDNCYFQSNSLTKNSAKAGFNNMSFEDFPSDQELDCLNPNDGANRTKTTPFEVVRNEKMLQEAEKKFGSLKRRTNLFSS